MKHKTNCSVRLGENWRKVRDLGNKTFLAGNTPPADLVDIAEEMADMLSRMQTGTPLAQAVDYGMQR